MATMKSTSLRSVEGQESTRRDDRPLLGNIGLIGVVGMLLASIWLRPGVVIAISCALLVGGFALAAAAWLRSMPQQEHHSSVWDYAGLAVLAGFAGLIGANTALF